MIPRQQMFEKLSIQELCRFFDRRGQAGGAVMGIVAIGQTAAPNSQTTSRAHGKVAAISAAAACGRRMLNDRGMERSPGTAAGTASGGGQCAAKSASEWAPK